MQLRPYQLDAIQKCREAYRSGARGVALVLPTGAGKTVVAADVARQHMQHGERVVFAVHRDELATQSREKLAAVGLTEREVSVESIQTMVRKTEQTPASLVIFDECHHMAADLWSTLPKAYASSHRLGLTATPQRGDGRALVGFDSLVIGVTPAELTRLGHLVPCDVLAPAVGASMADPIAALNEYAPGRPTVVFCSSVEHAKALASTLTAQGRSAACVDGAMPWRARETAVEGFRLGRLDVLTCVFTLTEGFDAPRTEVVVIARGCSTPSAWLQMIGRGLRPWPGKQRCTVLDCRGSVYGHGLPTDERRWSLTGKVHQLAARLPALRQCPQCGGVARSAPQCPRCGYEFPRREVPKAIKREFKAVTDVSLNQDAKRKFLAGLKAQAAARGYKPGWVWFRFQARWGHPIPRGWEAA